MKNNINTIICYIILLVVMLTMFSSCGDGYSYNEKIETEYGDVFTITCTDFQYKWQISYENNSFYTRLQIYNEEDGIIGIWNTDELRCYLVGSVIIFRKTNSETFERFDEDLSANEDMIPVVKSILLKNNTIMETYLEYFIENFPAKTIKMLEDFTSHKYDTLTEYGLTEDIIADADLINIMESIANKY